MYAATASSKRSTERARSRAGVGLLFPTHHPARGREDIEAAEGRLRANAVVAADGASGAGLDLSGLAPAVQAARREVEAELDWLRGFPPAGCATTILLASLKSVSSAIGSPIYER